MGWRGHDLVAAMERPPARSRSCRASEELQHILAYPFAAWRTFLHPSQRETAYRPSYSGPAQVTGGPGTGKTVTVLHRAAFLAGRTAGAWPPGPAQAPVLLTTFNGNLAEALQAQLDLLIRDPAVRRQIQVRNVDRLAYSIVTQARGTPVIADERVLRARWAQAAAALGLDFTPAFLKNEWEQVILAQDLRSEQAYLTCPRTGRGRPLTKAQRSQGLAGRPAGHGRAGRRPPDHPPAAGQRGHAPAPGVRERRATGTSWSTRPRTCTRPSGGCSAPRSPQARTTCSSRPTRTSASTTTGSRWPACGSACAGGAGSCP